MASTGNEKGFSLVEVLIAMTILTVGILAVISMQTTAMKVQSRSKLSAQVQLVAQEIMERIVGNSISDIAIMTYNGKGAGIKTNDSGISKPEQEPGLSDYTYFQNLANKLPGGSAEIHVQNTKPYPVTVTVYWKDALFDHKLTYATYVLPH